DLVALAVAVQGLGDHLIQLGSDTGGHRAPPGYGIGHGVPRDWIERTTAALRVGRLPAPRYIGVDPGLVIWAQVFTDFRRRRTGRPMPRSWRRVAAGMNRSTSLSSTH